MAAGWAVTSEVVFIVAASMDCRERRFPEGGGTEMSNVSGGETTTDVVVVATPPLSWPPPKPASLTVTVGKKSARWGRIIPSAAVVVVPTKLVEGSNSVFPPKKIMVNITASTRTELLLAIGGGGEASLLEQREPSSDSDLSFFKWWEPGLFGLFREGEGGPRLHTTDERGQSSGDDGQGVVSDEYVGLSPEHELELSSAVESREGSRFFTCPGRSNAMW
jgi:hypothetical protein